MRKRSVNHIADTIFWYAVYMLPLILTIIQSIGIFGGFSFEAWVDMQYPVSVSNYDFMFLFEHNISALGCSNGLIVNTLSSIFSDEGIIFFFDSWAVFGFAQWFVGTLLVHLCVDFILFIPRIAHKWLDDFAKKER